MAYASRRKRYRRCRPTTGSRSLPRGQEEEEDEVTPFDGFNIYVDPESAPYAQDITLDFVDSLMGRGFKIENPNKVPAAP